MLIKDYFIILVVVGIVIFSASSFIYGMNSQYSNDTIDLSTLESGNKLNEMQEKTESIAKTIEEEEISAGGVANVLFRGIGAFFLIILSIVKMPFQLIYDAAFTLGIPSPISTGISVLIMGSILFAIIAAILRRTP
ncbi:MAG: hypothetical protein QW051_00305 [Candidatus Aenigmatarchaeota archaeon]